MNKQSELLKQFTCTSSLILLTHPQLKEDTDGYFEILKIFDSTGTEVWNAGQKQIILYFRVLSTGLHGMVLCGLQ